MRTSRWFAAFLLSVCASVAPVAAQELTPEQQQAVDAYMKLMATNENHEFLKSFAGEWKVTTTATMQPGASPIVSEGSGSGEFVLGGRFLLMKFRGIMFGQPFEGIQIVGYDNQQRKYVTFWIDNTSTAFYLTKGVREKGANVIHDEGLWPDPSTGGEVPVHAVTTLVGPDEYTYELFMVGPDGTEFKSLENRSIRVK